MPDIMEIKRVSPENSCSSFIQEKKKTKILCEKMIKTEHHIH